MSGEPPEDGDRMARNLEHVRALRAALVANDYTELTTATPADLDAAERRQQRFRVRMAAAEARAAQVADDEAAQALSEDSDNLAEVIPLRPPAEGNGK